MNTFSILAVASGDVGFLWLVLLFFLCFITVHAIKLIKIGLQASKTDDEPAEEQEKTPPEKTSGSVEPVYYLVEKKKRRKKDKYSKPREITFS